MESSRCDCNSAELGLVDINSRNVLLLKGESLHAIIVAQLFIASLILFVWFCWIKVKNIRLVALNYEEVLGYFKGSLPFAASNLIWIAYFNFDAFMLSLLRTEADVGVYAAIYRIIAISYIIGYATTNTFTPLLFKQFYMTDNSSDGLAKKMITLMLILSVLIGGGLFVLAPWVVNGIIGNQYSDGIVIMKILAISAFFRLLNFGFSELLTTSGKQSYRVRLELLLLATNIGLNAVLIPLYGGVGAAIATLTAETILFLGVYRLSVLHSTIR